MNLDDFESRMQDAIEALLNQLQTLALSIPEQEPEIITIGRTVQDLAAITEEFIAQQRQG